MNKGMRLLGILISVLAILGSGCLLGCLLMSIWNWLLPPIFALPTISWVQSMGFVFIIVLHYGTSSLARELTNKGVLK